MANHNEGPPVGEPALEAINEAMVALHERYHGRRPRTARTQMMGDDMLACLLGDVYTDVEKTMIELQRQALVHETRSAFQQAMERRFIADVERLTGRRVAQFISTHHVGPDLELELFILEPLASELTRGPEHRREHHGRQAYDEPDDPAGDALAHEDGTEEDGNADDAARGDHAHQPAFGFGAPPFPGGDHPLGSRAPKCSVSGNRGVRRSGPPAELGI
jgi:uncharacterized protein YbcI